jgi:hypothetical protein
MKQPQFMGGFRFEVFHAKDVFQLGLLRHKRPPIWRPFLAMTDKKLNNIVK